MPEKTADTRLISDFDDFLQNVPAFAEFGQEEIAMLEKAMSVEEFPDGYEFIGEDQRGESMFLIIDGEVVATHRRSQIRGRDMIERLGPGDLFGLVALIDHRPTWATYRAKGRVIAASLPTNAFRLLFTADAPLGHHFQSLIAVQLVRDLRACAHALMRVFADKQAS